MKKLIKFLETSYTAYHAVENARTLLTENGFVELRETDAWNLTEGGKYFTVRGGSSLIAFTVGKKRSFHIIASHTDSPCFKLKAIPEMQAEGYTKLNAETYGGGIWYTFFDRPLKVAGRVIVQEGDGLHSELYTGATLVIPSLAVHMNRGVNDGFAPNPQTDLLPLYSFAGEKLDLPERTVSYDLFLTPSQTPFENGAHVEFLSSPRIDNLTSVFSSLQALVSTEGGQINVCACFDNEEVGSGTYQGAGGDFLYNTLSRIGLALGITGEDFARTLAGSFLFSLDNAHAVHPNHGEKCDPTNRPVLGGGIVIKSHANKAYTTDALTCAIAQTVFEKAGAKYQYFYNRSDMRSGGTLGAISLSQAGIPSCDIGLAQLAMHSAVETIAKDDYTELLKGLTAFYNCKIKTDSQTAEVK